MIAFSDIWCKLRQLDYINMHIYSTFYGVSEQVWYKVGQSSFYIREQINETI